MTRKPISRTRAANRLVFVLCAVLLFGIPLAWVGQAYLHGQKPFETAPPAWAPTPTR